LSKIVFLGASRSQLPIIELAKSSGHYCITIDNVPENPGHKISDEFINCSSVNTDGVYDLIRNKNIDAIISYASDIATVCAAEISRRLNLKSNSVESVLNLTDKERFRKLILSTNLNCPHQWVVRENERFKFSNLDLNQLIVKPSDSAGSKGVTLIRNNEEEMESAINFAMGYSMNKKVVIEEFIENSNGDVHGDGFVLNGELVFLHLGDHLYDHQINGINPTGTTWPSILGHDKIIQVEEAVKTIIAESNFRNGSINVEARYNSKNELFIMEIGPRNGGYFVPLAIKYSTGVDLVEKTLEMILGDTPRDFEKNKLKCVAYYALHSRKKGVFSELILSDWLRGRIIKQEMIKNIGDSVEVFVNSSHVIGVILVEFKDQGEMQVFSDKIDNHIEVVVC
jgi:carbamoylphosphate synthase large subunit